MCFPFVEKRMVLAFEIIIGGKIGKKTKWIRSKCVWGKIGRKQKLTKTRADAALAFVPFSYFVVFFAQHARTSELKLHVFVCALCTGTESASQEKWFRFCPFLVSGSECTNVNMAHGNHFLPWPVDSLPFSLCILHYMVRAHRAVVHKCIDMYMNIYCIWYILNTQAGISMHRHTFTCAMKTILSNKPTNHERSLCTKQHRSNERNRIWWEWGKKQISKQKLHSLYRI